MCAWPGASSLPCRVGWLSQTSVKNLPSYCLEKNQWYHEKTVLGECSDLTAEP